MHPTRRAHRAPLAATLAAGVAIAAAGCASPPWATVRDEVVLPLNKLVHKRLPGALETGALQAVAVLYRPGPAEEKARADYGPILERFARVDDGYCRLVTVSRPDDEGVVTMEALLRIDAELASGQRFTIEQDRVIKCARDADGQWEIVSDELLASREHPGEGPRFTEEAEARGIAFDNRSRGLPDRDGAVREYHPGSGLAVGDIDGDGLDDVLLVGGGELRLYRNTGGAFADETDARGIATPAEGECRMAVFGDVDGDGDRDVFVGVCDGENLLFRNDGTGRFTRVPAGESGITSSRQTTGAAFADFDGDGDLDLTICNGANLLRRDPDPIYDARNGTPNQLFANDGDGRFVDVSEPSGIDDSGWGLAVTTSDYDRDGDVDILFANDFGFDALYRNEGDGTFEQVAPDAGVRFRGSGMSAAFGDYDGDGDDDIFIAGMASDSRWILDQESFPAPAPWPIRVLFRDRVLDVMKEMFHGNRLYRNDGDGAFTEISRVAGVHNSGWAWGGIFLDYDNDGRLDIYNVNGFVSGEEPDDL